MKCAKICGDTSGNYHPHGEAVIYPTLVHMAQPWAMRERLVDPQGNFGSVEGDPPAAMRYTEARLTPLGGTLMQDMDKDTVDFVPNYDERLTEPVVFPAAFPNLLVNGGTGIAVGMATNIPPHNLGEIIDGICAQIDYPQITVKELMKHVKGPDFPTGCMVCGLEGIKQYFHTGRGSLKVRGIVNVEELKGGREQIIITEIPFNVNRAVLVERIAELVNEKIITDITGVRDESDENTRVVIEIKRDAVRQGGHQQSLPAHRAGNQLRGQRPGHRSRPAEDPRAEGAHQLLHRAPARGDHPPHEVRAAQGRGAGGDPGRLPHRPVQPGRVHPHHPQFSHPRGGQDQAAGASTSPARRWRSSAS